MSNVLSLDKQQQIQTLSSLGWSGRQISRELGVHRKTVNRYIEVVESVPKVPKTITKVPQIFTKLPQNCHKSAQKVPQNYPKSALLGTETPLKNPKLSQKPQSAPKVSQR